MLKTTGLTLHYGGSQILHGVDIEARAGEVTCVMGTNGVGKTSLLKAISGTHPRSGGEIELDGAAVGRVPAQGMAHRGVGYVPQGRMIFPLLTVRENLETGFACLPRPDRVVPDEIYELFPVLRDMAHRRGGDLSGGQQQQLAIARAMITKPKLLLLDEPTEGIQPNIIQQIGRVIDYLRDQGRMAIVLVEQYFEFAYALADRFYVMERGAVTLSGSKAELAKDRLIRAVSV
ncbi:MULTISPECIES: urea ABC transporter ATP-binding subunit UrtE [Rhodovulum]|uniref:Amino acid/amide ABC transporter ATP-binding protein 2 (HAAT family) n=2 Tax=Rhodovulum TaxID=34008 RepID=A0A8E2VLB1_9RHOB|nr:MULTISPECIES: urea ABC transporter ATP-binding subunit UrtE [Rhodovulum]PTW50993.1 amino acid/amide ABC transporter ATP-binding protein 2 (HAAT family) [Rhodovulum kholense]RAP42102.1 urea ABC transporter ATP-binding subunit UrtE [Rhodovulum viride]